MSDVALLIGRLALVALYVESAVGKFGALDGIAGALAAKGDPAAPTLVAAGAGRFSLDWWRSRRTWRQMTA
jgi:uncharacterized membrane protein YphA (DoxX/SURF4 family)